MSVGEMVAGRVRSVRREMGNPLYRNAYALMLNTVVNSGFGLLYWVFAARVFSTEDVGRGNAMVNLMMLISVLTSLNFGQALIRFLPTAGRDSRSLVRLAYGISAAMAVVGSAAVMTYCHVAYAPGDPLHVSPGFAAWFVVSTAAWSIFNLQDQVLTGLRSAMWVVLENGVYGVVKLGLLVVVAFTSVSDGVFTSWSAPVIALLVPFTLLISRRLLPRHTAETADRDDAGAPDRATLARYMGGDYLGQVFNQAMSSFLPVLVVMTISQAASAYLLPAQTVFLAMSMLSMAITSALVVEGSRNPAHAHVFARAVLRRICLLVWPASLVIALAAPLLLWFYGPQYVENSTTLLQLLMASMFPRVIVTMWMTKSRLANRTFPLAVQQLVHCAIVLGGIPLLAPMLGVDAVGWMWLAGELVLAIAFLPSVVRWLRQPVPPHPPGDGGPDGPAGPGVPDPLARDDDTRPIGGPEARTHEFPRVRD
ncbi:oligosaccharide flippase family protein [Pseudonocardia sp. DR1-2]|uniref:lipopolysaccharide biosynthesis protein n=1 Tax=Pseudonocardia sp. DR1-2 TaxID=2951168 RepID=UPI0020430D00|nr:oligosaccharide flippase family protein [Pseudonocardia sp. DR1-2]MCM3848873.1 oligosaccharide flippase family protein [Pseudonocardia sp. DR1-2]